MSKEWFIKERGQVCFKSDDAELNGWDTQSLVDCLNGKEIKISDLEAKLAESNESHHKNIVELTKMATEKERKIEELKQQLAMQEHTITTLIEDNRASQEWYKMQLADKDAEIEQWKSMAERSSSILDRFNYCGESIIYNTTREQDKISFAVDVLEEIADCSNYINSKLDFECGSYVSEKAIRDKIKYLKGKKDEYTSKKKRIFWQVSRRI